MNESLRSDQRVTSLAARGEAWAKRLIEGGWSALRSNQKRAARAALGLPNNAASAITPRVTRYRNANPTSAPRRRGEPGNAQKSTTITRSEFIKTVGSNTSQTGKFSSWVINPRNVGAFPQISAFAAGYNKYSIKSFRVRYSPMCNDFTTGRVALAFSTDSTDAIPATKYDLFNLGQCVESPANKATLLTCSGGSQSRFLRDSTADDGKMVDYGRVILCTYGQGTDDPPLLGELFFEYTVVFTQPCYTYSFTQNGSSMSSHGPAYGVCSITEKQAKITLLAAGKFLVTAHGTNPGSNWVVHGAQVNSIHQLVDVECMFICTLSADEPGASISASSTHAVESLTWHVCRM